MARTGKAKYDAVIIGAGIGGLVCGCYLAKAGMEVLVAEQHFKPGGYCTSFKRKQFTFDAAAHCFGGYRKGGITRKVFEDLSLENRLSILQSDPSNVVITPDYRVAFWADPNKTIDEFQRAFPAEQSSIRKFFEFLVEPDANSFSRIRTQTLNDLLDVYFKDSRLKAVLTAPLLGLGGLPPSQMSAFIGAKLFSEFLLDGGYHPQGGMQALSDILAERFRELGGELRLSCLVKKISVDNACVTGIFLDNHSHIRSKYVISNCDARQTFLDLLGKELIQKEFCADLAKMVPSISNFVLYLGLDQQYQELPSPGTTWCFFSHYDLDKAYHSALEGNFDAYGGYMFYISTDLPSILAIVPAPYNNSDYWEEQKYRFSESFIRRLEKNSIPHLSEHVVLKEAATPCTLHRYTLNYRGASFGWAGTPSQLAVPGFKKYFGIEGLYLTGHWTTQGLGISGVTYVGKDTAKIILKKEKITL